MKAKTISSASRKINAALEIPIERIIPDFHPLVAAILLSGPDEYERISSEYPFFHPINQALDMVRTIATDRAVMYKLINEGFFSDQLKCILQAAKKHGLAATRLMPVLFTALHEAEYLNIPISLQRKIEAQIEHQYKKDGFVIREVSENRTTVRADTSILPF